MSDLFFFFCSFLLSKNTNPVHFLSLSFLKIQKIENSKITFKNEIKQNRKFEMQKNYF